MGNPIYNGGKDMGGAFASFMRQNKGKDPDAMIQEIVRSGRISQAQLDMVQQQARRMGGLFDNMKSMFGF